MTFLQQEGDAFPPCAKKLHHKKICFLHFHQQTIPETSCSTDPTPLWTWWAIYHHSHPAVRRCTPPANSGCKRAPERRAGASPAWHVGSGYLSRFGEQRLGWSSLKSAHFFLWDAWESRFIAPSGSRELGNTMTYNDYIGNICREHGGKRITI